MAMPMQKRKRDAYELLVSDLSERLEATKEQLDAARREVHRLTQEREQVVSALNSLRAVWGDDEQTVADSQPDAPDGVVVTEGDGASSGPYAEATVEDGAAMYLREVGMPFRDTREVMEALLAGGQTTKAKNPYSSYFGTLNRASKRVDSPLVKVDGKWGLKEWQDNAIEAVIEEGGGAVSAEGS